MPNMGYCRFQNTFPDLRDCYDHWEDLSEHADGLSENEEAEIRYRKRILKLCKQIVEDYGKEI